MNFLFVMLQTTIGIGSQIENFTRTELQPIFRGLMV